MMRRRLAIALIALVAACSKMEKQSAPTASEPAAQATAAPAAPSASAIPPSPFATAPETAPTAPQVAIEPAPAPTTTPNVPRARPQSVTPNAPAPAPKPANKPKTDDDGLHSSPAPSLGVKKVAVLANNHYTCSSTEKRDNVAAIAEPRGARISIVGQGPCPGEVHDWSAQVTQQRVEVHGTHGSASKCRCVGSGELVLRGLDPGTYDIAVNGGFDRPIATRITILQ